MITQMVYNGKESGAFDGLLDEYAVYYEPEVNNAVNRLAALMEPMVMSVLGILSGGFITTMHLPIFQLGAVV